MRPERAAAKAEFAEVGPNVSLEEIARRAGVGIGTLYRHFNTPTIAQSRHTCHSHPSLGLS